MKLEWLEKALLTLCVISTVAFVGEYIKDGFRTYETYMEVDSREKYISVKVAGEVRNPAEYKLIENSRLCDSIYAAGGITNNAYVRGLKLDAVLTDKMEVYVPSVNEYGLAGIPVININTADADLLAAIPFIGQELAERIVDYRAEYGNFSEIDDIKKVKGIGDKNFNEIKNYIKTEE